MKCPYCKNEFLSRHVPFCVERDKNKSKEELRAAYFIFNIPELFEYNNLVEIYVNNKKSLPEIRELYNIDYKNIQFMLRYYNIPIRSISEGCKLSTSKKENTCLEKYGAKNVLSKGTVKYEKRNKTVKEKYGVDNVFQIKEIIEKINDDEYYLKKYGINRKELIGKNSKKHWDSLTKEERSIIFKNFYSQETMFKIKQTKINNKIILSDEELEPYKLYRRNCRRLTKRNTKELYEMWNGYDYYDNEYIKDNFSLDYKDPKYPTIDHKISIYYGFKNGILEEEISNLNNLCITKRSINSSKGNKIYEEKIK